MQLSRLVLPLLLLILGAVALPLNDTEVSLLSLNGTKFFSLPVEDIDNIEGTVAKVAQGRWLICKPKTNKSDVKEFHVNVDDAKAQAKAVGFTTGKSGDPHEFKNTDKIQWGVKGCNKLEADMYEYPIFWEGAKVKQRKKDEKTSDQGKTPIRVVYVQTKDKQLTFCGVMIHVDVLANYQGEGFFAKCNP